jgi:hypothetical protein
MPSKKIEDSLFDVVKVQLQNFRLESPLSWYVRESGGKAVRTVGKDLHLNHKTDLRVPPRVYQNQ